MSILASACAVCTQCKNLAIGVNLKFHVSNTLLCFMPLGTWAEVKVHSYHALTHVCVGSCMCCAQPTPLSKLQ